MCQIWIVSQWPCIQPVSCSSSVVPILLQALPFAGVCWQSNSLISGSISVDSWSCDHLKGVTTPHPLLYDNTCWNNHVCQSVLLNLLCSCQFSHFFLYYHCNTVFRKKFLNVLNLPSLIESFVLLHWLIIFMPVFAATF